MRYFRRWSDLREDEAAPQIFRRVVFGRNCLLSRNYGVKGAEGPRHSHDEENIIWVMSGRMRFWVGDEEKVVGPDDVMVIPANVVHGSIVEEDATWIEAYSPVRLDVLPGFAGLATTGTPRK